MEDRRAALKLVLLIALSIIAVIGLTIVNYRLASQHIGGEDFLIYWVGTRALVTKGLSPYAEDVSRQILAAAPTPITSAGGFVPFFTLPLYSALIVLPFSLVSDLTLARTLWMGAQEIALVIIILTALHISGGKPRKVTFILLVITLLFSYQGVISLLRGSMAIWVALLLPLAFTALHAGRQELAATFIALATIQPLLIILVVAFVIYWGISQRKRLLVIWTIGFIIFLTVIGLFFVRDWPLQYIRIIMQQSPYSLPNTPIEAFLKWWPGIGEQLGWLITGTLGLVMIFEWWQAWRKDFRWFLWTACLTLVISQLIGIPTMPDYYIVLALPLILIVVTWDTRWKYAGPWVAIASMLLLFLWEWGLYIRISASNQPMDYVNLLFPFPLIVLIGLYWMRWWITRPRRLLLEEMFSVEEY